MLDQFCCTVVKCGKLLLWMRRGDMGGGGGGGALYGQDAVCGETG